MFQDKQTVPWSLHVAETVIINSSNSTFPPVKLRLISCLFTSLYSGKGDSFGENFAIDPDRPVVNSNASIRALTYCELRLVSREDVLHILRQYPLFKENFIKDLEITYNLRGDEMEKV